MSITTPPPATTGLIIIHGCKNANVQLKISEIRHLQIDDYSMVRFLPYDQSDEESMNMVLQHVDFAIQYGEDLEFKEPKVVRVRVLIGFW